MKYPAEKIKRILLISTRQIGDVLLTTPLLHSLRLAYPKAELDVLVFRHKGGILDGNPDIDQIITIEEKPTLSQYWALLKRIYRRYDLAVSTLSGDRPLLYAFFAAPRRAAIVPPEQNLKSLWKRLTTQVSTPLDDKNLPTVLQNLRLAEALGIQPCSAVVPPLFPESATFLQRKLSFDEHKTAYAVLHLAPMWHYKRWPQASWIELAQRLRSEHNLRIVLTGGPDAEERDYVAEAQVQMPEDTVNLVGRLSFDELSALLIRAKLYVGPDTAATHLAAACGTPTVALFGPTNPVKWGPWPAKIESKNVLYERHNPYQQQGNVILLQGPGDCVPCHEEGCDQHRQSHSRCLDELPVAQVLQAAAQLLDTKTIT